MGLRGVLSKGFEMEGGKGCRRPGEVIRGQAWQDAGSHAEESMFNPWSDVRQARSRPFYSDV